MYNCTYKRTYTAHALMYQMNIYCDNAYSHLSITNKMSLKQKKQCH